MIRDIKIKTIVQYNSSPIRLAKILKLSYRKTDIIIHHEGENNHGQIWQ